MRRLPALLFLVAMVSSFACGGGDDDDGGRASPTATPDAPGATEGGTRVAPTPSVGQIESLLQLPVPGFTASGASTNAFGGSVTYTSNKETAGGAQVVVLVQLAPCDPFICGSLDAKSLESPEVQRNMKSVLPSAHIENPALRWEFGAIQLSSTAQGLFNFAQSYVETRGADGSVSRSSTNGYRAWYHNGGTLVSLEAFPRSKGPISSLQDLERQMTRGEAEQAAKDVFAAIEPNLPR